METFAFLANIPTEFSAFTLISFSFTNSTSSTSAFPFSAYIPTESLVFTLIVPEFFTPAFLPASAFAYIPIKDLEVAPFAPKLIVPEFLAVSAEPLFSAYIPTDSFSSKEITPSAVFSPVLFSRIYIPRECSPFVVIFFLFSTFPDSDATIPRELFPSRLISPSFIASEPASFATIPIFSSPVEEIFPLFVIVPLFWVNIPVDFLLDIEILFSFSAIALLADIPTFFSLSTARLISPLFIAFIFSFFKVPFLFSTNIPAELFDLISIFPLFVSVNLGSLLEA